VIAIQIAVIVITIAAIIVVHVIVTIIVVTIVFHVIDVIRVVAIIVLLLSRSHRSGLDRSRIDVIAIATCCKTESSAGCDCPSYYHSS